MISDDLDTLFREKTNFNDIEEQLLKKETRVDYVFPEEAVIIDRVGKVISSFLNNSQEAVKRIRNAAVHG